MRCIINVVVWATNYKYMRRCVYECDNNNIGTSSRRRRCRHHRLCRQLHHTLNGLASVVVMAPRVTFYSVAAVRFSHRQDKLVD